MPSTTADDAGGFSLTVDWPAHWHRIILGIDREGYEAADVDVQQTPDATREVLITTYRSLTISPGESIQTTLSIQTTVSRSFVCGWWLNLPCRRVLVNSPSGELIDLEVFPADGQKEVGLARGREQPESAADLPSRLTVAGGDEVWIVVNELGRLTLRAAGR